MGKFIAGFFCGALSLAGIIAVIILIADKISVVAIKKDFPENNEEEQ